MNPRPREWTSIKKAAEIWKVFLQSHPKESKKISSYLQPVAAYWFNRPYWVLGVDNKFIYVIMVDKALQVLRLNLAQWKNFELALPGDKKFFYD